MAGRYLGIEPIEYKGRKIKQNEIIESMTDAEAEKRIGFEPVKKQKPQMKENKKENENE